MMILNFHNKDFSQSKEIPVKAEGYTYILNSDLESDFDLINDDTSKLLFTELFQEIKAIDLTIYPYLSVKLFENNEYIDLGKVRESTCRVIGYMGSTKNYHEQERLSIKFEFKNRFIINNNGLIYCNTQECPFYDNEYCLRYKTVLELKNNESIVCKQCFINIQPSVFNQLQDAAYKNMINKGE